ncbi:TlyA family RNA methyltransferase [Acetobacteraceae bacterium]|nr:TlyA family RNA methyltransferase [Acetobacteraceae bacterium]
MAKKRADQLLAERGLAESRTRAQAFIMAGLVYAGENKEHPVTKAGQMFAEDVSLFVKGKDHPWVSRGGMKLAHALEAFKINPTGWICLDVGSSTGGFTDVLLTKGAKSVYAVDVGTAQLAWKLREDDRVIVHEQTNARHLTKEIIPQSPDIIVCDASFISLKTVLPASLNLAHEGTLLVALIKPQFEAKREEVGKKGVVRDENVHQRVCQEVTEWLLAEEKWEILGLTASPILGPEGNKEFLIVAKRTAL